MEVFKLELLYSCFLQSNNFIFKQDSRTAVARAEAVGSGSSGSNDIAGSEVDGMTFAVLLNSSVKIEVCYTVVATFRTRM